MIDGKCGLRLLALCSGLAVGGSRGAWAQAPSPPGPDAHDTPSAGGDSPEVPTLAPPPVEAAPLAPVVAPAPPPRVAPAPPVSATPPAASPPPTLGWSPVLTGSYFTRYEVRANYDDNGVSRARFSEGDAVFYRVRFGIGTGAIDVGNRLKVALQLTPQASGTFGANGPATVADATLGLHEGYARIQGDYLRFDAGRFEMLYGDALLIGQLDWNETGRSFDGLRTRFSTSPTSAWVDLFVTVIDEGRDLTLAAPSRGFGDGDIYFYGLYAAMGPAIAAGLDLDVYALGQGVHGQKGIRVDPTLPDTYTRKAAHEQTFGARAKQRLGMFDYRAETGLQTGSRLGPAPTATALAATQRSVDMLAYHGDLELGVTMLTERLRLGVEGVYASGDDPSTKRNEGWDELYPTGHKWLGLADVINQNNVKRTNLVNGELHFTIKPLKDLTVQIDEHVYARPEKVSATGAKGFAGSETDVGAAYVLAKGLRVRGLYAMFVPDQDLYPVGKGGHADPIYFGEVEVRYDL